MSLLIVSVEGSDGGPEANVRLEVEEAAWRCSLPDYDAFTAASLRWLLEDYSRLKPSDSRWLAKVLVHARVSAFGHVLHESLFGKDESRLRELSVRLEDIDIVLQDPGGLTRHWPWELVNWYGAAVVHNARSFVRRVESSANAATPPGLAGAGPLRVLMVISRPAGLKDVRFRTVASRVLHAVASRDVDVEVLRPPTLDALESRLFEAKENGEAFDVVHFDGHGGLVNAPGTRHGALLFESTDAGGAWVGGGRIASKLKSAGGAVLLLNACRSAQAPLAAPRLESSRATTPVATASLAEEIARAGIEVVAMSHAVHVATAAHITSDVYAMLAAHRDVADAVRFARRRWIDGEPAIDAEEGYAIVRHFGHPLERRGPAPEIAYPEMRAPQTPAHPRLPAEFHGSGFLVSTDDALLSLEQRLRRAGLVEIRGLRGSGKTALLLEFGRWLVATKGAQPEAVHYIDLAREPLSPIPARPASADRQVVLFDNARAVHGDPLRGVPGWDPARMASWRASIDALIGAGAHVIVATCAPLSDLGQVERMPMLPVDLEDLRDLVAQQTRGEVEVPDLALLWTGGNPGAVDFMVNWARGGTWQILRGPGRHCANSVWVPSSRLRYPYRGTHRLPSQIRARCSSRRTSRHGWSFSFQYA